MSGKPFPAFSFGSDTKAPCGHSLSRQQYICGECLAKERVENADLKQRLKAEHDLAMSATKMANQKQRQLEEAANDFAAIEKALNSETSDALCVLGEKARGVLERAEKAEAELAEVENQRDAILLEARCWAGEAKGQRHTVNEVGSALGGVPDWGPIAKKVREKLADLAEAQRENAYMREALEMEGINLSTMAQEIAEDRAALPKPDAKETP